MRIIKEEGAPRLADNFLLLNYFHSRVRPPAYRNKPHLPRYFHAKLGLILCSVHRYILTYYSGQPDGWTDGQKTHNALHTP